MQAFTKEDANFQHEAQRHARAHDPLALDGSGILIRTISDPDLGRILELRKTVRWFADPRAFGLFRNLGLASALSLWSVSYLHSRGARVVRLDSTHDAKSLYEALGFEPVSRRSVHRLEGGILAARLRGGRSLDKWSTRAHGVCVTPLLFGDLPELYGVDRWSFGGDRSALIRAILNLHPGWGLIARDASGRVNGYLIRTAHGPTVRIGPFMASSPDIARVLLAHPPPDRRRSFHRSLRDRFSRGSGV